MRHSNIIVALDYADKKQALAFVERISPEQCKLKVGKEMFTLLGPGFVAELVARGYHVFLDLKYHDIPNTVARACRAAADLGVWMLNVHASGGRAMMEAAVAGVEAATHRPLLIAVTILTSLSEEDMTQIGYQGPLEAQVKRLAVLTEHAGLDGVVCSPKEIPAIRAVVADTFQLVTPGIRPAASAQSDQKRVMTPEQAMRAGTNYLVIGRPITQAQDPLAVLAQIQNSLSGHTEPVGFSTRPSPSQ